MKKESFSMPKKINLLGKTYKIKLGNCRCKKCYSEHAGHIDIEKCIIELDKSLTKEAARYVLFHELAHFFADYYNLENSEVFADAFTRYIGSIISQLKY